MVDKEFKNGLIKYTVRRKKVSEISEDNLNLYDWDDGYLAFSNKELRMSDNRLDGLHLIGLLNGKIENIDGIKGYLLEVGLWRKDGEGSYEEISIEREDRGFLVQQWKLTDKKTDKSKICRIIYIALKRMWKLTDKKTDESMLCYYRKVETIPREHSIFKKSELKSIEVIVPENRLHFFLTVGGDKNGNR